MMFFYKFKEERDYVFFHEFRFYKQNLTKKFHIDISPNYFILLLYCDMTPESRNSGARVGVYC
jgi:hypothetical protein